MLVMVNAPLPISEELSRRISCFSVVAACLVVLIHVELNAQKGTMAWWTYNMLGGGVSQIAVPFFFCVSVFFIAGNLGSPAFYLTLLRKRIKTLFVPYTVCCLLWFFYIVALSQFSNISAGRPLLANVDLSLDRFVILFGGNPFLRPEFGVLWYIRTLLIFVIISPLLIRLANAYGIVLLFVCYLLISPTTESVEGTWKIIFRFFFSLEGLFYFCSGIFLRIQRFRVNFSPIVGWGLFLAGTGLIVGSKVNLEIRDTFNCFGVLLSLSGAWLVFPSFTMPKWFLSCAFPIYILHGFCTIALGRLKANVPMVKLVADTWWGYLFLSSVVVVLSIVICCIIRKRFSLLAKYLFGGR